MLLYNCPAVGLMLCCIVCWQLGRSIAPQVRLTYTMSIGTARPLTLGCTGWGALDSAILCVQGQVE